MKIVFLAAVNAPTTNKEYYAAINNHLTKQKHKVYHLLMLTENILNTWTLEKKEGIFYNFYKMIRESDIVIAECSSPSTNLGFEISHAIQHGKTVIILQATDLEDTITYKFLYTDKNAYIYKYQKETLLQILDEAIELHTAKNNNDTNSLSGSIK